MDKDAQKRIIGIIAMAFLFLILASLNTWVFYNIETHPLVNWLLDMGSSAIIAFAIFLVCTWTGIVKQETSSEYSIASHS